MEISQQQVETFLCVFDWLQEKVKKKKEMANAACVSLYSLKGIYFACLAYAQSHILGTTLTSTIGVLSRQNQHHTDCHSHVDTADMNWA